MAKYLSLAEVLRIHSNMIRHYGGSHGVRDLGLVKSAIARPRAGFGDFEAYPDLFDKAAIIIHSLLKNHPFIDGNKRTAIASCALFLKRNGYKINMTKREGLEFTLNIENDSLNEKAIAVWIKKHSVKK